MFGSISGDPSRIRIRKRLRDPITSIGASVNSADKSWRVAQLICESIWKRIINRQSLQCCRISLWWKNWLNDEILSRRRNLTKMNPSLNLKKSATNCQMQFGDIFTDLQTKNITGGQCANTAEKYSSVVPLIYGNMSKLITNTNYKRINIIDTVFKNHRKSLIQHCERSELHLHLEWTKVN